MSNKVRAFTILRDQGFPADKATEFLDCLETDESHLATKGDIQNLKADMFKELNAQTWKFLGGITIIATIFKAFEFLK